jgi:hypothetical protein
MSSMDDSSGDARDGRRPPSTGPSQWESRAAYRQHAEGFNDPALNGVSATATRDPREEILRKFEPKERLLPRTPPKPKHQHIPTEVLIAMGGASLETAERTLDAIGRREARQRTIPAQPLVVVRSRTIDGATVRVCILQRDGSIV